MIHSHVIKLVNKIRYHFIDRMKGNFRVTAAVATGNKTRIRQYTTT